MYISKIQASDAQADDYFGYSVAVSDNRIVVGASEEDTTATDAGSVYIFNNFYNNVQDIAATVYRKTGISLKLT